MGLLKSPSEAVFDDLSCPPSLLRPMPTELELTQNILAGAYILRGRLDDLIDLAKGEVGLLKVEAEPVDPIMVLKQVASQTLEIYYEIVV